MADPIGRATAAPSVSAPPAGRPIDEVDVVVAGSGPAALALASACAALGLDVCSVGPVAPWRATYGVWLDEVEPEVRACVAEPSAIDVVVNDPSRPHTAAVRRALARTYGVLDNDLLRRTLGAARHVDASVSGVVHQGGQTLVDTAVGRLRANLVVDATGAEPKLIAARSGPNQRSRAPLQTAYGLVVAERPAVLGGESSVLMDWREPPGHRAEDPPTFLYVLALGAGRWLVEETSLARRPGVTHEVLRARLAARLGQDLTARAEHVELVSIPMAPGLPLRSQQVVGFGAAAGYIHPATGYSVTASLRAAPRVAAAIADALGAGQPERSLRAWDAVWPAAHRRSRALHDYGLAALLRMPADELGTFFGAFFELPTDAWSAYLRVDVEPTEVMRTMRRVFRALPWSMRARLAAGSPLPFARLLR